MTRLRLGLLGVLALVLAGTASGAPTLITIGILGGPLQPVVVASGLRGVPERGIYAWDPGSRFGLYSPDTVYWQNGKR